MTQDQAFFNSFLQLHPAVQVTIIVAVSAVVIVWILALFGGLK